jgi:hypothetical protein
VRRVQEALERSTGRVAEARGRVEVVGSAVPHPTSRTPERRKVRDRRRCMTESADDRDRRRCAKRDADHERAP